MKKPLQSVLGPIAAGAAMAALVALTGSLAWATEAQPAAAPDNEEAHAILADMGAFLAAQDRFTVEVLSSHDSAQPSGQKIEFVDKRKITLDRPSRLRVDVERSDGEESRVIINPTAITAQNLTDNVFAQTESRGSIDESLRYFIRDLRMRMPMAILLTSDLADQLDRRVVQADVVEETMVFGKRAYHIAGSTDTVDFQIWVQAGSKPLPQRMVLTYRDAPGEPQYRAQFTNWNLSPWLCKSTFEPRIGKDAAQIAFLNQVQTTARPGAGAPEGAIQ